MKIPGFCGPTYADRAHGQLSREVCENLFCEEIETPGAQNPFAKTRYLLKPVPGIDVVTTIPDEGGTRVEPKIVAMRYTLCRLFVVARYGDGGESLYEIIYNEGPPETWLPSFRAVLPRPAGVEAGLVQLVTMGDTGKLLMVLSRGIASYLDISDPEPERSRWIPAVNRDATFAVEVNGYFARLSAVSNEFAISPQFGFANSTVTLREQTIPTDRQMLNWSAVGLRRNARIMDLVTGNHLVPFALGATGFTQGDYVGPAATASVDNWSRIGSTDYQGLDLPAALTTTGVTTFGLETFVVGTGEKKIYRGIGSVEEGVQAGTLGPFMESADYTVGTVAGEDGDPSLPPADDGNGAWTLDTVDVYATGLSGPAGETGVANRIYVLLSWTRAAERKAKILVAIGTGTGQGWGRFGIYMDFDAMDAGNAGGAFAMDGIRNQLFLAIKDDPRVVVVEGGQIYFWFDDETELSANTNGIAVWGYTGDSIGSVQLWDLDDNRASVSVAWNRYGWDPLQSAIRSRAPEKWESMAELRNEVYLASESNMDLWRFTGAVLFPFQQGREFIKIGVVAPGTFIQVVSTLCWVGGSAQGGYGVYTMRNYQPTRVSTHAVERWMTKNAACIRDATAWSYERNGHPFYGITIPGAGETWVLDLRTQLWHTRRDGTTELDAEPAEANDYGAAVHEAAWAENYVGDSRSGKIGRLTDNHTMDFDGRPYLCRRIVENFQEPRSKRMMVVNDFQLDCEVGVGLEITTPLLEEDNARARLYPLVTLCWSRDNKPFLTQNREIGARSVTRPRPRVLKCGMCRTWTGGFQFQNGLPIEVYGAFFEVV